MTRSPRGFVFSLEPLRTKLAWEVEQSSIALAAVRRDLVHAEERLEMTQVRFATARTEWNRTFARDGAFDTHSQRIASAYLSALARDITDARSALDAAQQAEDEAVPALATARRSCDAVERLRDEALEEFRAARGRAEAIDADEAWLLGHGESRAGP